MITLEVKDLMVFYENAIAINNVRLEMREGAGDRHLRRQQRRQIDPHVHHLRDYPGCETKGEAMRGGETNHHPRQRPLRTERTSPRWSRANRARMGIILCPERRRIFQESSVLENLKIGGILATKAQGKKPWSMCLPFFLI